MRGIMPNEFGLLSEGARSGPESVVIAVAAGKNDDAKFHAWSFWGGVPILAGLGTAPEQLGEVEIRLGPNLLFGRHTTGWVCVESWRSLATEEKRRGKASPCPLCQS
jgi:hypothetical protein